MSLKIFIDTNIYINAIENRDSWISKELLIFLSKTNSSVYLNDLTIINIHYITRKSIKREEISKSIKIIIEEHNLVSIGKDIILNSLNSNFKDFEDWVQFFCAKEIWADIIITDNKKDFINSDIKVLSAKEFSDYYTT